MPRKYTKVKEIEEVIYQMKSEGMSNREISERYRLELKQVKNLINRHNRNEANISAGAPPKLKGRPRKRPLTDEDEKEKYIKRLEMENKLLRDFLHLAGRK